MSKNTFIPTTKGLVSAHKSQDFTSDQKAQGRTNISAVGTNEPLVKNLRLQLQSANSGGTWGPRDGAIIAFLGSNAFMIGGWAGANYDTDWSSNGGGTTTNQIYRSTNYGTTWTLVKSHDTTPGSDHFPQFHYPAWCMHTVSGTDYIYLLTGDSFGEFPNVVRSSNGTTWEVVNSGAKPFNGVFLCAAGSIDGKMYLVGGHTTLAVATARNTVYKSTNNGVTWTQLSNAPWTARATNDRLVAWKGKLWMVGGSIYDNDNSLRTVFNDVWTLDPDTDTWEEVLANGLAPWEGKQFANVFVYNDWLYISRGATLAGNTTDTWRTADGVNWSRVDALEMTASHADGCGVHSSGILFASGNGWLTGGSPENEDSPSYFASIASETAQESIAKAAHEIAATYDPDYRGIDNDSYTEGSSPRGLTPGANAKIKQIRFRNKDQYENDIAMIGGYASSPDVNYVFIGGGLDADAEPPQALIVCLGAAGSSSANADNYLELYIHGTKFKKSRFGLGASIPNEGINAAVRTTRFGANEGSTTEPPEVTAGVAKVWKHVMPNHGGTADVQVIGAYAYSANDRIVYVGGGMSSDQAATVVEIYTGSGTIGTLRLRINNSGIWIDDGGTMKLLQLGAADSGGSGYKMLRVVN